MFLTDSVFISAWICILHAYTIVDVSIQYPCVYRSCDEADFHPLQRTIDRSADICFYTRVQPTTPIYTIHLPISIGGYQSMKVFLKGNPKQPRIKPWGKRYFMRSSPTARGHDYVYRWLRRYIQSSVYNPKQISYPKHYIDPRMTFNMFRYDYLWSYSIIYCLISVPNPHTTIYWCSGMVR